MSAAFRPGLCQVCKLFRFSDDTHVFGLCIRGEKAFTIDHRRTRDTCRFHQYYPSHIHLVCTRRCPRCNYPLIQRQAFSKEAHWFCGACGYVRGCLYAEDYE